MAAIAETTDRTSSSIARFVEAAQGVLSLRPTLVFSIVEDLIVLVRELDTSVHADVDTEGTHLILSFGNEQQATVFDRRARHILRMMCANLAVRSHISPDHPETFFQGSGEFHDLSNQFFGPGWRATWENTPSRHWFELAWQGGEMKDLSASEKGD